ncbi:kynurenine aminotransferase-like isoform X3 [Haemaphysalis longicornis]
MTAFPLQFSARTVLSSAALRHLFSTLQSSIRTVSRQPPYEASSQITLPSQHPLVFQQQQCSEAKMSELQVAKRLEKVTKNIWDRLIELAGDLQPVNLCQGFPTTEPPSFLLEALSKAALDRSLHQYTYVYGHPRLVQALSRLYSGLIGRGLDPGKELLITVGAQEALYCSFQAFVNPGDEVILIEPFFSCYKPMVQVAEGVPVYVPLRPTKKGPLSSADWQFDRQELASKFTAKTKMIIVNNPNNPLGKVYSRDELEFIAGLCKKHNVICVSDEVYEWLVLPEAEHVRINGLPGMWERTITIGSAGKAFSVTGWRVGWAYGPEHLIRGLKMIHHDCTFSNNTVIQEALSIGLEEQIEKLDQPNGYWNSLRNVIQEKRDYICTALESAGLNPTIPQGAYFVVADGSSLADVLQCGGGSSLESGTFAEWLLKEKNLLGVPLNAFYGSNPEPSSALKVRFCFIKEDSTLQKAAKILAGM